MILPISKAISRSMCLDHTIAHGTYHCYLTLPLKPTPTCFTKQRGTFRTQEFKCKVYFGLLIDFFLKFGACDIPLERS